MTPLEQDIIDKKCYIKELKGMLWLYRITIKEEKEWLERNNETKRYKEKIISVSKAIEREEKILKALTC